MALVLGELTDHLKKTSLEFTVNGVKCVADPDADTVLRFQADYRAGLLGDGFTPAEVYQYGCALAGGKYDAKKGHATGAFFDDLYASGVDWRQLDRVMVTIVVFFYYGETAAETYFATGDLGKAINPQKNTAQTEASDETA